MGLTVSNLFYTLLLSCNLFFTFHFPRLTSFVLQRLRKKKFPNVQLFLYSIIHLKRTRISFS